MPRVTAVRLDAYFSSLSTITGSIMSTKSQVPTQCFLTFFLIIYLCTFSTNVHYIAYELYMLI